MEPWYKVAVPRAEVREGRSFNPDEFAIALEQIVAGTAPEDYRDPAQFFARTCFTRALREHVGMVLRRLAGRTENTAPVLTLITQFGGGKTHTLATLYHLVTAAERAANFEGVTELLKEAGLPAVPKGRVAVFVGNAWDPSDDNPTPWVEIARQLAGEEGVLALGPEARSKAPGTISLQKLFEVSGGAVLVLFDEVLNFLTRYREQAEAFRAFLGNLVRATTGTTHCAAVVSLPQSKPELDDWELRWQELIAKEVGRVAKQLIANDESEISEVVRRRLFEDVGNERIRKKVCKAFADWCFERRAQLPPECTAVDSVSTEAKAREALRRRFEACYPFHPATLSVFQRKWQALPQYQQTRGTLAMLAQWISWAYREGFTKVRTEPLITLGSAPLHDRDFRSMILGQLGEPRLEAAITADIGGEHSHARALDADTKGPLRDIHKRVGAAILFESSGGQVDKVAHLPELRFALGEPGIDTTSVDNAAHALESRAYFIQKVGSDGYRISHRATLRKVVSDRRASLDEETEVKPAIRRLVEEEFRSGASIPVVAFPQGSEDVPDAPKLTLVVVDPDAEWHPQGSVRAQIDQWTRERGKGPRLYPAALVWCVKKPGRELRDKVEVWLAWQRVAKEFDRGLLGEDYERTDREELRARVRAAAEEARDEVWAGYRFVILSDSRQADGLGVIDLGAGHASSAETLCGRVIAALKSDGLLSESVGAGYIERNWPAAFESSGAWPLASLRQSFLNGSLTRLLDPDSVLRAKIVEFVEAGDFGLASGQKPDGRYERIWFEERLSPDEISFEADVYLLTKAKARELKSASGQPQPEAPDPEAPAAPEPPPPPPPSPVPPAGPAGQTVTIRIAGNIPPELWNRVGMRLLPRLRTGAELTVGIEFVAAVDERAAPGLISDLQQSLADLGLTDKVWIES